MSKLSRFSLKSFAKFTRIISSISVTSIKQSIVQITETSGYVRVRLPRYSWPSSILRNSPCFSYSTSSLLGPGFLFRFPCFGSSRTKRGDRDTRGRRVARKVSFPPPFRFFFCFPRTHACVHVFPFPPENAIQGDTAHLSLLERPCILILKYIYI